VILVQCVMYDGATKGQNYLDMTKYDMKIRVETGSPRIVYLNSFIEEIMVSSGYDIKLIRVIRKQYLNFQFLYILVLRR
jgi:hypothetical protein